jgi:hypothetical protein
MIPRRKPLIYLSTVPGDLAATVERVLCRLPAGVAADFRGRANGIRPALRIGVGQMDPGLWGLARYSEELIVIAPHALRLPADALDTLVAHELVHFWLAATLPEARVDEANAEPLVNDLCARWGFDVAGLFQATGIPMRRDAVGAGE